MRHFPPNHDLILAQGGRSGTRGDGYDPGVLGMANYGQNAGIFNFMSSQYIYYLSANFTKLLLQQSQRLPVFRTRRK